MCDKYLMKCKKNEDNIWKMCVLQVVEHLYTLVILGEEMRSSTKKLNAVHKFTFQNDF